MSLATENASEALDECFKAGARILWPGDPRASAWGFTVENWDGSVLVLDKDRVLCVLLHAHPEGQKLFRRLLHGVEASGYRASVPCPLPNMQVILRHYGFEPHVEDMIQVWERRASQ